METKPKPRSIIYILLLKKTVWTIGIRIYVLLIRRSCLTLQLTVFTDRKYLKCEFCFIIKGVTLLGLDGQKQLPHEVLTMYQKVSFLAHFSRKHMNRTFGRVPSENSEQFAHSCSLIRIFTKRILDSHGCKVPSCGQRRFCANTRAGTINRIID